jgi:hypothetical protein
MRLKLLSTVLCFSLAGRAQSPGSETDGDVDGPVGDLPISHLDVDGVDEYHWAHRLKWDSIRADDPANVSCSWGA